MARTAKPPQASFFTDSLFAFLRDLAANNDRAWFQEHRARFEKDVKEPMQAFLLAATEPLGTLSPHFTHGTTFRIFRDTRFSRDKSPYKTNVGAHFRHADCPRDVHSPGFYLHLEPGASFIGVGIWHPDAPALQAIRTRIAARPKEWEALAGLEIEGDRLKRVPQGFPSDHPMAEALKLKDFFTNTPLTEAEICAPGFMDRFVTTCGQSLPLMAFLTKAMDLPW